MKKLTEQKQTLDDVSELIRNMDWEIKMLRAIAYRYYLEHGILTQSGIVNIPDNISFDIHVNDDNVFCRMWNHNELGIESNYQRIIKEINKLK